MKLKNAKNILILTESPILETDAKKKLGLATKLSIDKKSTILTQSS